VSHPEATEDSPPPFSTSYIILTTNLSYRMYIGSVVPDSELGSALLEKQGALDKVPASMVGKARELRNDISHMRLAKQISKWTDDGGQPLQAVRYRWYRTTGSANSARTLVKCVLDLRHAACVIIDEVHLAGRKDTSRTTRSSIPSSRDVARLFRVSSSLAGHCCTTARACS